MKKQNLIILLLFCVFFGVGGIWSVLKPDEEFSELENRYLETMPEPSLDDILSGDFQESYEAYVNDQFLFRDSLVNLSVWMQRTAGKSDVNGVYIGKDGFLLEKYTEGDFDEELTGDNIYLLSAFLNCMTDTYGEAHVSCMMVPGKANVLAGKLPEYAVGYDEAGVLDRLAESLTVPDILLNPTQTLKEHQEEYIYYRTDHHWTTLGAYYAYVFWAEAEGHLVRSLSEYEPEELTEDFYGTTYNKVHLPVEPDRITFYHSQVESRLTVDKNDGESISDSFYFPEETEDEADKYRIFFGGNTAKIVVDTTGSKESAAGGRTLLLIKDSFANSFVPFAAQDYDRIIMIDPRYYSDSIEEVFRQYPDITDIMVLFNIEKFMEDAGMGVLETTGIK